MFTSGRRSVAGRLTSIATEAVVLTSPPFSFPTLSQPPTCMERDLHAMRFGCCIFCPTLILPLVLKAS